MNPGAWRKQQKMFSKECLPPRDKGTGKTSQYSSLTTGDRRTHARATIGPKQMVVRHFFFFVPRHATTQVAKCYHRCIVQKALERGRIMVSLREQRPDKARNGEENAIAGDIPGWIKTWRLGDMEEELQQEPGRCCHTLSSLLYDLRS